MRMGVIKVLTEVRIQRVNVNVLDRGRRIMGTLAAATTSLAQAKPIGGPIATSGKTVPIHERFQDKKSLPVFGFPVTGNALADAPQNMTG